MAEDADEPLDLNTLSDEELVPQMHDDLYDGMKEEVVDGVNIVYQSLQPQTLTLAAYYDPRTLAPVAAHGNQVIFVNLKNAATAGAFVTAGSTTWTVDGAGQEGALPIFTTVTVSGVTEMDLVSLVGEAANRGPGRFFFNTTDTDLGESRLIFFVQSLGTFGTGYLLPPVTF